MKKNILMKAVSMVLSMQMVCAVMPQLSLNASAEASYYLNENFSSLDGWATATKAALMNDEETQYMRYQSDEETPTVASRTLTKPSSTDLYVADLDVRFENGNSGVVEFWGGSNLGPTIIYDGTNIKTKTGNPSTYVTMYSNASADTWYNVKLIANGRSSVNGYTTEIGKTEAQKTSSDIKRNLRNDQLNSIRVTNHVNSESDIRSGYADVRNLKVYKPLPDTMEVGGDAEQISVPQTSTASIAAFTVKSAAMSGIELKDYDLLGQGIVSFKLYDAAGTTEVTPAGVSIDSKTGVLSVTSAANGVSEGTYTVKLVNYDASADSAENSKQIEVVAMGEAKTIEFVNAPSKIPVPSAGEMTTEYSVKVLDDYGSEMGGVAINWSLTDTNGNAITDDKLTITDGVVTAKAGAQTRQIRVKAEAASNSEVYALSDPIEVYTMAASTITIKGDDYFAVPASGNQTKTYTAQLFDANGLEMPASTAKTWSVAGASGISIADGVLTVPAGTANATVTITVEAGSATQTKKVTVYNPTLTEIEIDGDRSIEVPTSGTKNFAYTAKAIDQYGYAMSGAFTWDMTADDNTGLTWDAATATVTAGTTAKEQTITVKATSGTVTGEQRVVVTENPFRYKPVDGGFEIDTTSPSSAKNYTRPIYAPHINDKGETSNRYLYYLGDRPKLVLSNASTSDFRRFMHMFLGIKGGKWLDDMKNVTARYVDGHEEYEITDDSFAGKIKLTYTRSDRIDGMMIKVELPDELKDKLVVAVAGQGSVKASQPTGGNSTNMEYNYEQTKDNTITISDNAFKITNNGKIDFADGSTNIDGTASVEMTYEIKDASKYSAGVDALLSSTDTTYPMVVGTTDGNNENTIYLITAPQSSKNEPIANYQTNAKKYFDDGIAYYKGVSETIKIDTPDPYINSGVKAQVMAMDNIWDDPVITHGAIGWHNGQGGWRGGYCFVDALWGDRLKTNIAHYVKHQESDGRVWAYPSQDGRYNMSLVMVDILMQYWDWTGDKTFFTDSIEGKTEAVYNLVKGHLAFMDKEMQVPGTNLYENWLDAWNTDNKWNNGGAGSIATSYTWRAYNTMAQIAGQLGKTEDAAAFKTKADAIKADMNAQLWDTDTGVFGELRERFGQGRLNAAPDLSSVYTVVDMGLATDEQVYQMMRFTDYAVPSLAKPNGFPDKFWNKVDFKYSSNRPPEHYSSDGLYVEEVMNNALAFFENGQREMGMKQFWACIVPLMKGSAAGQGTVQHIIKDSLENNGHIDFGDCTSQYARTALEGIFGVKMHVPEGRVDITPGFPEEWEHASVETSYLSYDYKYENNTDKFTIKTTDLGDLSYVMHIPARSSKVESVKVNGSAVTNYTVNSFVNVATPAGTQATVEVEYANDAVATVEAAEIGGTGADYAVTSNGTIKAFSDPQGVLAEVPESLNAANTTVKLANKKGNHIFFVTVEKDDMTALLPVDVEIKDDIEIIGTEFVTSGATPGIKVKLANNTEKSVTLNAVLSTVSGSVTKENITIAAKGASEEILVPVESASDLTPGNNKITAVLSGGVSKTITGEATDWTLKPSGASYKTVSLDSVVNQDLRTLHSNTYDLTYEGNEHYRLPTFYWVTKTNTGTPRTVLENGRSWWETSSPSHAGANGVPSKLTLTSGNYTSGIGVPFNVSSKEGHNAAFVSLYNQFPDTMNIPVNVDGSKIYFMLSVSTNNMQSRIENARITVNLGDGTKRVLPLTNPDNIDDWLNYQTANPYAESGYIEMFGDKAHANILSVDLGRVEQIESVDFECLASEVLAGLLGVTVVEGEYTAPSVTSGEITFDKTALTAGESVKASATVTNSGASSAPVTMMLALYNGSGALKELQTANQTAAAGTDTECSITYAFNNIENGDYIKAFLWNGLENMKPLATAKALRNN